MRTFCIAIMLCTLSACESIIDLETPRGEHKIVAHGFFTPDSVWVDVGFHIHTSGSPVTLLSGDSRQKTVVMVKDDTGGVDTLQYYQGMGGSNYRSVRGMRPNVTYTLRVETPDVIDSQTLSPPVPVEASAQLPERTPVVQNLVYSNDNGTSSLRFSIEDPPGANYYRLELFQVGPEDGRAIRNDTLDIGPAVESVFNYRKVDFRSTDPSFRFHYGDVGDLEQRDKIEFDFYGRAVFSDALFDGASHDIEIAFEPYTYPGFKPQFSVIFSTLSSDLFMYLNTLDRHVKSSDGSDYSSEVFPVPVYGNIKNGYGIFAGYVSDTYRFDQDGNEWGE